MGTEIADADRVLNLVRDPRPVFAPYLARNVFRVSWPARGEVIRRLIKVGHPQAREALRLGAVDEDPSVRAAVARLLVETEFPAPDLRAILSEDPDPRVAWLALGNLKTDRIDLPRERVFALLERSEGPTCAAILDSLSRDPEPDLVWQKVDEMLRQETVADPDEAARWLFEQPRGKSADVVLQHFNHPVPCVRSAAVAAWSRGVRKEGRDARLELRDLESLLDDKSACVRTHAAGALAKLEHGLARAALVRLSRDEATVVRDGALRALGRLDDVYHVLPVLRRALDDDDAWVKNAARLSLVAHGRFDVVEDLLEDLTDPALSLRTKNGLNASLQTPCQTAAEFRAAFDREHPEWNRKR